MTGHALDLTRHHFVRTSGDIQVVGTWIGESVEDSEPCLAFIPSRRKVGHDRIRPCCVALSAAYKYEDPSHLLDVSRIFVERLGFVESATNVHRMAELIHGHLQDLVEMPPRPVRSEKVGATAVMADERGRTREAEILDLD